LGKGSPRICACATLALEVEGRRDDVRAFGAVPELHPSVHAVLAEDLGEAVDHLPLKIVSLTA
jgi:hypothetical protein